MTLTCSFWKRRITCLNPSASEHLLLIFLRGKPQDSIAPVWIGSKFQSHQLFLTDPTDFTLAGTTINIPKNKCKSQEAGSQCRIKQTNQVMGSNSASEYRKEHTEKCKTVSFKCCDDTKRRRWDIVMNGSVCSNGFVCCPIIWSLRQWERLWEWSKETDPTSQIQMEISVCAFFPSHDPTPRKTSHLWNPSGLGSGSGRGQKGDSAPRYSRFSLTVWTKMHLWQRWENWQELLSDAELRNLRGSACPGCSIKPVLSVHLETETLLVWKHMLHLSAGKTLCVESNSFRWLRQHLKHINVSIPPCLHLSFYFWLFFFFFLPDCNACPMQFI